MIGLGLCVDGSDSAPAGDCLPFALAQAILGSGKRYHVELRYVLREWMTEDPRHFGLVRPMILSRRGEPSSETAWPGLRNYVSRSTWLGTESLMAAALRFGTVITCLECDACLEEEPRLAKGTSYCFPPWWSSALANSKLTLL